DPELERAQAFVRECNHPVPAHGRILTDIVIPAARNCSCAEALSADRRCYVRTQARLARYRSAGGGIFDGPCPFRAPARLRNRLLGRSCVALIPGARIRAR